MNEENLKIDNNHTDPAPPTSSEQSDLQDEPGKDRYVADFITIERRVHNHTIFQVDDTSFVSSTPRATHWSIAWSDLMMTMFILFLVLFIYQSANQEFLGKKNPEIIGGDTREALESMDASGASFPFAPISPGLPLMTGGTIKKVEPVKGSASQEITTDIEQQPEPAREDEFDFSPLPEKSISPEKINLIVPQNDNPLPTPVITAPNPQPAKEILEPPPLETTPPEPVITNTFQEIFAMSKEALDDNDLRDFAAIDIIPDKTMRIILTSDLLFALGQSELSYKAVNSLGKIAAVIRLTPYMINVVGHTDNIPMRSNRFQSNWELSVARATTVARFFIDEMGMNPNQFVVSGYSSYRPLKPNTNSENRAKNRRVEIIISKRLPRPLAPTANNLK